MTKWTQTEMEKRLVRYADLKGLRNAFIDARTPGSDRKENFTIIGPGVSENKAQVVHIPEAHGFNFGAARQPFGCTNSQHSHLTAETFLVHTGKWRFVFGANKDEGYLDVEPGDVATVPTHMFRGFEKRDEGTGFLAVVLGHDDPGKVVWAPSVFKMAEDFGLKLLKGGKLVDTTLGETVPEGAELELPPDAAKMAELATPPMEELAKYYLPHAKMAGNPNSPLAGEGVEEAALIGDVEAADGFAAGPIVGHWQHGFALRRLKLETGASIAPHSRSEQEVVFVQSGTLEFNWEEGKLILGAGDTLTVPVGLVHGFRNPASADAIAFVIRGSAAPAAPQFATAQAAE
ncbi:cupin domain-containing protein [Devosia beringensis]|uniref:cupin domain-containing protein n=1 Tax=Devosia beringensis TaxID=2657486 RepID=UPI00186B7029|nr:cupin domain-containing protein [Devosia beringensis]